jgi:hypothetical protein
MKDEHCLQSTFCVASSLGHCKASNGDCVTSDEACGRMDACARYGECHAVEKHPLKSCGATVDADCVQSAVCREAGRCTASGGGCIATRDDDCKRSYESRSGRIKAGNSSCTSPSGESVRTAMCRELGRCNDNGYAYLALSEEDCKASLACKEHGACKHFEDECAESCATTVACRKDGTCTLGPLGTCVAATDAGCRASTVCLTEGRCTAKDGACVATDASCGARWECRWNGACSASSGRCRATSDADCAPSEGCKASGRCRHRNGTCVVAKSEDCARSLECAGAGRCIAASGFCQQGDDAYCRGTEGCRELGQCSAGLLRCEATADEDCRASAVCKKYGWCEAEQGSCFIRKRTRT